MKHFTYRISVFIMLTSVLLFARCGSRSVSFNAMRPAEITFPSRVNTMLIVDRTKFEKSAVNIIEGLLTGELPGEDRAGYQEMLSSFQSTMMRSGRFEIKNATEILNGNSITSAFPTPLTWSKVEQMCSKYNSDVLVAVEVFDTDYIITNGKRKTKKKVTEGGVQKEIEVDEFYANGVANVNIGFRVYDPTDKKIIDQQMFKKSNTWEATAGSAQEAALKLVLKSEATKFVSRIAGDYYAYKLAPMPIRLSREFYGKSNRVPQMKAGTRQADVNNWAAAIETWKKALPRASRDKEAGRLCYNIAVGYEVLGDLSAAKEWAGKAYVEHGNKKARSYSYSLEQRMADEELARKQME